MPIMGTQPTAAPIAMIDAYISQELGHLDISVTKNGAKRSTASLDCPLTLARNLPFRTFMLYCVTPRYVSR
jgi:hypothetical protein